MFDVNFWMPESVNALTEGTDELFMFILWISVFFTALIVVAIR